MTPYTNFLYFAWLIYPLAPTLLLRGLGRFSRYWIFIITALVLVVQYNESTRTLLGATVPTILLVLAYALYQYGLTYLYLGVRQRARRRGLFYLALSLSLVPLIVVKLAPVLRVEPLIGFLGISYISFRALDALIGVQDGLIKRLPLVEYFTFLLFFPTISSGPIDRYRRFDKDWSAARTRAEFVTDLDVAVHKIMLGFLYKFILAYLIKQYWLDPVSAGKDFLSIASYTYAYSFYLFFDFAGYSFFAIGLSYLFGIHTPDNFHRPFLAENIGEFWNRWHMSLSFWFRDHIYGRFLMAATRGKWFGSRYLASYLGFILTFGLMGLWHGVVLNYIAYGLYHAGLFITHDLFSRWNKTHHVWKETLPWRIAGIVITFNLVCFGFLIFSGHLG